MELDFASGKPDYLPRTELFEHLLEANQDTEAE